MVQWSIGAVVENPLYFFPRWGRVPMVVDRIDKLGRPGKDPGALLHNAATQFDRLYFDTANAANPVALAALGAFANPRRILLGTDYPYVSLARGVEDLARSQMSPGKCGLLKARTLCY